MGQALSNERYAKNKIKIEFKTLWRNLAYFYLKQRIIRWEIVIIALGESVFDSFF